MSDPSLQNGQDTQEIRNIFTGVRIIGSLCLVNTICIERLVASKTRINIKNKLHENIHNVCFKTTQLRGEKGRLILQLYSYVNYLREISGGFCLQN